MTNMPSIMKPQKGVRRADYPECHIQGWYATLTRFSGHTSKLFSDSVYGGKMKAYKAACGWYEEMEPLFPVKSRLNRMETIRSNNRSGISGVFRWPASGEMRTGAYWGCQYVPEPNQKPVRKKFPVARYGEAKAKRLAIEHRINAIHQIEQSMKNS